MVTSRSVPQQTAPIFSPLAGQYRTALRFSQIEQFNGIPQPANVTGSISPRAKKTKTKAWSGHDDFLLKAPRGDYQQKRAHGEERQPVQPQVSDAGTAQNHSARDIDEIARRNEITDHIEEFGHGLPRKNVTRKKNTWQDRQKRQLHGLRLRI